MTLALLQRIGSGRTSEELAALTGYSIAAVEAELTAMRGRRLVCPVRNVWAMADGGFFLLREACRSVS